MLKINQQKEQQRLISYCFNIYLVKNSLYSFKLLYNIMLQQDPTHQNADTMQQQHKTIYAVYEELHIWCKFLHNCKLHISQQRSEEGLTWNGISAIVLAR